jgi:ATP/ADP translocase/HEAT repeat protein
VTRWLRSIVDVRQGEVAMTLLMFGYYYLLLVTQYFLKPARDSIFLVEIGPKSLPIVFMLIAVVVVPVTTIYSRAGRTMKLNRLITLTTVILIACLLILRWLLEYPHAAVFYTFYIWVSIYGALSSSQFWLLANGVFDATQAKRLFVLFGLGGIVGAFTGGELTSLIVEGIGVPTKDLLFICVGLLALCGFLVNVIWSSHLKTGVAVAAPRRARRHKKESYTETLSMIKSSRHLMLIVGVIAMAMAVTSFTDYQFKTLSSMAFTTKADLTSFLGKFYGRLSLISFVIQLLLSYRLLRWFGVGGAILLLPTALLAGSATMLIVPGLMAGILLRGSEGVFKYSIDKTARELLFLPVPLEVKQRTKVFIDIFVDRWFRGFAGGLLLLLTTVMGLSVQKLSIVVITFVAAWIVMAIMIRKEYVNAFRRALERREIDLADVNINIAEASTVDSLTTALGSSNERQIVYALDMLQDVQEPALVEAVAPLLKHPTAEIRSKSLLVLAANRTTDCLDEARELLNDPEPKVRLSAMAHVCENAPDGPITTLRSFLESDDMGIRATALGYIAARGGSAESALVNRALLSSMMSWKGDDRDYVFVRTAEALGALNEPDYRRYLVRLLGDDSPTVVRAAIRSAGHTRDPEFVSTLFEKLKDKAHRAEVGSALAMYGDLVVRAAGDFIVDPTQDKVIQRSLCRVLGKIPTQKSVDTLVRVLQVAERDLRYDILKALNVLRGRHDELDFNHDSIDEALIEETESYYGILQILNVKADDDRPARALLQRALTEKMASNLERMFRLLGLTYSQRDIYSAYVGMNSENRQLKANAIEFLDNVLKREVKRYLFPIVDNITLDFKVKRGEELFEFGIRDRTAAMKYLIEGGDLWLKACAIFAVNDDDPPELFDCVRKCLADPHPIVQEIAQRRIGT